MTMNMIMKRMMSPRTDHQVDGRLLGGSRITGSGILNPGARVYPRISGYIARNRPMASEKFTLFSKCRFFYP